jgi:hypothetical protein
VPRAFLIILFVSMGEVACGGGSGSSSPASASAPKSEIARIHRAKCGSCHVRVEPGERTRAELEAALSRHHKRAHLTEEQWSEMVDYLAAPADAGMPQASPPDAGRQ